MHIEWRLHVYLLINCVISPRILKESWRAIIIVNVVRRSSFVVVRRSFVDVTLFPCPPMISLNGWRYEILEEQKSFVSTWRCATEKKNPKKSHFFGLRSNFSRKFLYSLSPHDFSKRLKIWNFDRNKKVSSWWVDVQQQRKFRKKSFFWPLAICFG